MARFPGILLLNRMIERICLEIHFLILIIIGLDFCIRLLHLCASRYVSEYNFCQPMSAII